MRYQVKVNVDAINVEGVLSGANPSEIARSLKSEVAKRAGLKGMAIRMMSDETFWAAIVNAYNKRFSANEPAPKTADELIEFGVRTGYLQPLDE
jgi:hypothetical protein